MKKKTQAFLEYIIIFVVLTVCTFGTVLGFSFLGRVRNNAEKHFNDIKTLILDGGSIIRLIQSQLD